MSGRRSFLKGMGAAAASAVATPVLKAASPKGGSSKPGRPNVILVVSDEHQANTCGCYGSEVRQVDGKSPTPHIDWLAGEGVRFDSMYCPSPLCAPSRAAYMTGMYPHTTTALYHKMQCREAGLSRFPGVREDIPGMGQYFRRAGYRTAAYGKMHVHGELVDGWDLGFDERGLRFYTRAPGMHYADLKEGDINRRYREISPYPDYEYKAIDPDKFKAAPDGLTVRQNGVNEHFLETLVEREEEMIDTLVTDRSIEFIERKSGAGEPFFVHVGLEKPHRPWTIHKKFLDRFDPQSMPLPETIAEWKKKGQFPFCQGWSHSGVEGDAARNSTAAYYACASQVDDCVGRIIRKCRELGILENTILIYTSDHGENLYEHGLIEKHNMLDPAARVPFVIRAPWAIPQGTVCTSPANLIDMLPTLCEMTGTAGSAAFEGASLLPAMGGCDDADRMVFSEFYQAGSVTRPHEYLPVRMGLNRDYKYIYTHAAADQLYDRTAGGEASLDNMAFQPENEARVSQLKLCTLANWELDEYPQLEARVGVSASGVRLSWEAAGCPAHYDVYRSASADPAKATRVASGLQGCQWTDSSAKPGSTVYYWVLGHYILDRPFTDHRGKSRYGDRPILTLEFPRKLPVTRTLEVEVTNGADRTFPYRPMLGATVAGLPWVYTGMPPEARNGESVLSGPVTLLSPAAIDGPQSISLRFRLQAGGRKPTDILQLLFNYQNMERYSYLCLQRDGSLSTWMRSGEWKHRELGRLSVPAFDPAGWNSLNATADNGVVSIVLNGAPALDLPIAEPYTGGRFGFDLPLHAGSVRVAHY